jgi:hypothetical protein
VTRRELLWMAAAVPARAENAELKTRIAVVLRKHLDSLLSTDGSAAHLKGKAADGMMAACFEMAHETFGDGRYHAAALQLADRVLAGMRKMPVGVLAIKEKDKPGDKVMGGGPPALGWYAAALGKVCKRAEDLRYVAGVLDRFAWNPKGWWAATVDVKDGHSPLPMDKPSPVNKNAGMALACATVSEAVKALDAKQSESLRQKTLRCLHEQILPAQLPDGFWHYGLTAHDPGNKDVHGYFMLTTELLIALTKFAPSFQDAALEKAIAKAEAYAAKNIAPNTDPYAGDAAAPKTASTPAHYNVAADPKRGYMLSVALVHGKYKDQAEKIAGHALDNFPSGDRGQDGAHCAYALSLCL